MFRIVACAVLVASLAVVGCDSSTPVEPAAPRPAAAAVPSARAAVAGTSVKVFATGLRFPRGFTFGGGSIYVAEAGNGGTHATRPSQCEQVPTMPGPYTNGRTARISRIGPNGRRSTVASGFPSGVNAFGDVVGVADVAFVGTQLVALVAGGGCSHGTTAFPAGVAKVSRTSGEWSIAADLSAFQAAHPVAHPFAPDYEPDGTWYSMLHVHGQLFAVEPNHGEVVRIDPATWKVRRLADVSGSQGHIVPTALAERSGNLFFSHLGTFPVDPGSQKVFRLAQNGNLSVAAHGFTAVLGLDFDAEGRMYVLEMTNGPGFPTPETGRVVRVNRDGSHDVIVDGLFFPTAMRFGPDGKLYISNKGFGPPQPGELLQVTVP